MSIFEKKDIKFEIITPVVMAGADQRKSELREQSIKGIIRWWYRFYKGAFLSLENLRKEELEIFGSQEKASKIKIKIKEKNLNDKDVYLCMNDSRRSGENDAKKNYSAIKRLGFNGDNFVLEISYKLLRDPQIQELNQTLWFLTHFGGIGARWRRGFGSVMREEDMKESINSIKNEIDNLKSRANQNINHNFIHLGNTEVFVLEPSQNKWENWENAINDLRDNFYRKLKNDLKVEEIKYGRRASPLIIQIKRFGDKFYGIVLVWKKWENWEKTKDFVQGCNSFRKVYP